MALLRINTAGDSVLRKKSAPVEQVDEKIKELIANIIETMQAANGLGFAAPQVGVLLRIFVIDKGYIDHCALSEEEKKKRKEEFNPIIFINPEIVEKAGSTSISEGCLSVPGYQTEVERADEITLKYTDINGKEQTIKASGLYSIAIQHEYDHLEGILFIDRISNLKKGIAVKKVKKYLQNIKANGDEIENTLYGKP
ncbi:MAG: peptide deformylase [bacterium]